MTDFIVWQVIAHYIPQEYFIPISIFLGALLAFEQWLASTNRIKANSTFQALTELAKYILGKMTKTSGGSMKSLIVLFIIVLTVVSVVPVSHAQDVTTPTPTISWPGLNIGGDTAYLFTHNAFAVGTSVDLLKIKDGFATLRGTAVFPTGAEHNMSTAVVGLSAVINLQKAIASAGSEWLAKTLNPSIGAFGGYDFGSTKWAGGLIMTVLKVEF